MPDRPDHSFQPHATAVETLTAGIAALDLNLRSQQVDQLMEFLLLIDKWNRTHNLTSVNGIDLMVSKHLLDSLCIHPALADGQVLDVGSGAGLPGIPLAIARPGQSFTLVDSSHKRCAFLKEVKRKLGLTNVDVFHTRIEQMASSSFDIIVSRAYSSLLQMLAQTDHLLAAGGCWYAMKGRYPQQEISEIGAPFAVRAITELQVPGLAAERHLVIIGRQTSS